MYVLTDKPNKKMYKTRLGRFFCGDALNLLKSTDFAEFRGKVHLIITSPPFPLNNKKRYGNLNGDAYRTYLFYL